MITKEQALEALCELPVAVARDGNYYKYQTVLEEYITQSGWMPIDDWQEDYGNVAIVLFQGSDLYCTLFTTPLSSDYPEDTSGLVGYFKLVDTSDLTPAPEEQK